MKIYKNTELTNEQYHAMSGISSSMIVDVLKSPYIYWYNHINPYKVEKESPEYFLIGTVTHSLVLEPDLFDSQFAVAPKVDRRTTVGKKTWDSFTKESDGKTVVKIEHYEQAEQLKKAVMANPVAKEILSKSEPETSFFVDFETLGVTLKVRTDAIAFDHDNKKILISDLKTTTTIDPKKFTYEVKDLYLFRAAFYVYVVKQFYPDYEIGFGYIAVSKTLPPLCTVFEIPTERIESLMNDVARAINTIVECNEEYGEEQWIDTTPNLLTLEL